MKKASAAASTTLLLSLASAQFLQNAAPEPRQLISRSASEGAYLAALVIAAVVVVLGISGWIFIQVFKHERKEIYSNMEFEIPDFKIPINGQSAPPAKAPREPRAKDVKKGKRGKKGNNRPQEPRASE